MFKYSFDLVNCNLLGIVLRTGSCWYKVKTNIHEGEHLKGKCIFKLNTLPQKMYIYLSVTSSQLI